MRCLGIDPGIKTGWALVDENGNVIECGRGGAFPKCGKAIIELPQVYRAAVSRTDPKDLITLAVRVGQYKERLEVNGAAVKLVQPATWKGQISKSAHHQRVLAELRPGDKPAVRKGLAGLTPKQAEDVWDAIALVRWAWDCKVFALM